MPRILTPSLGPTDWRRLLADPMKHWKRGRSALEVAVSWEAARNSARGMPLEISNILDTEPSLQHASLLLCIPEHQVHLEGGGDPSQNDLWALLSTQTSTASLALEAKSGEPLDKTVAEWSADAKPTSRKPERLRALKRLLGLSGTDIDHLRYQLLHRSASALLEAERFRASVAIMLIQSFDPEADRESCNDFNRFVCALGTEAEPNRLVRAATETSVPLFLGWVSSPKANEAILAAAV